MASGVLNLVLKTSDLGDSVISKKSFLVLVLVLLSFHQLFQTSRTRTSMSRSQRLTERGGTMLRCVGRAYTKVPFMGESEVFAATAVYMVSSSCCDALSRSSIW